MSPIYLKTEQLSRAVGISQSTLRRLCREGKYPFLKKRVKLRGVWLFAASVVNDFKALTEPLNIEGEETRECQAN